MLELPRLFVINGFGGNGTEPRYLIWVFTVCIFLRPAIP